MPKMTHDTRVATWLTPHQYEWLSKVSQQDDMTLSAYIRKMINQRMQSATQNDYLLRVLHE